MIISVRHNAYLDPKPLAAALALYNAEDVEIGRIILYTAGRTPQPEDDSVCRNSPTVCTVSLTPDQLNGIERAAISGSSYAKLLVNMGKGAESFTLNQARFPALK